MHHSINKYWLLLTLMKIKKKLRLDALLYIFKYYDAAVFETL